MATIFVVSGPSRGFRFHLEPEPITVGRDEACDVQIVDDLVSRRHMRFKPDQTTGGYEVSDLGSSNGVYIHEDRIEQAILKDGDLITIGDSKLLFTTQDFEDGDSALSYFKLRGQRGRSTIIRSVNDPGDEE